MDAEAKLLRERQKLADYLNRGSFPISVGDWVSFGPIDYQVQDIVANEDKEGWTLTIRAETT